jgi:hypothetical protein
MLHLGGAFPGRGAVDTVRLIVGMPVAGNQINPVAAVAVIIPAFIGDLID